MRIHCLMPASYTYLNDRSKLFSTTPVDSRIWLLMTKRIVPVNGWFAFPGRYRPPHHKQFADVLDRCGVEFIRECLKDRFAYRPVV